MIFSRESTDPQNESKLYDIWALIKKEIFFITLDDVHEG